MSAREEDRAREQERIRQKRGAEEARRRELRDQRTCAHCSRPVPDAAVALGLCPHCGKAPGATPVQPMLPLGLGGDYKAPPPPVAEAEPAEIPPEEPSPPSLAAPPAADLAAAKMVSALCPDDAPEPEPDKFLKNGYPDYGGPSPTLVWDQEAATGGLRRPPPEPARKAEAPERQKPERERRVTGYAKTKVRMTFHAGGGKFEHLEEGTVVELVEPSPRDQKDLDHWERTGRQHVVVRWTGGISLVLGKDLARTDLAAWREQETARKKGA